MTGIKTLEDLWVYTNHLHKKHFPESKLEPIHSGGKLKNPKYMFVFINPTYKNVSSKSDWQGKRRPWTGTKYIWRIFTKAGLFSEELLEEIENTKEWSVEFADKVYAHLENRGYYITNTVKWTGENADLPDTQKINLFSPILKKEIQLVNPHYIVTFGLISFNALSSQKVKLTDYYDQSIKSQSLDTFELEFEGQKFKIVPCYFPVGRGNPKRAVELLKLLP